MKKIHWKKLLLMSSLILLFACGSDDDDEDLVNIELPQEEEVESFSTRLSSTLLIAGTRCEGNETTIDATGMEVGCEKDNWLITIDNVNTCSADSTICTEVAVTPIVAELDRNDRIDVSDESTFFEIDPVSAVTPEQSEIADDYLVRFELDDKTARVISR